jgi:signal transduction histidine kinase
LSIAKRLIDNYGGEIHVASKPGEGTEVFVSFPPAASEPD